MLNFKIFAKLIQVFSEISEKLTKNNSKFPGHFYEINLKFFICPPQFLYNYSKTILNYFEKYSRLLISLCSKITIKFLYFQKLFLTFLEIFNFPETILRNSIQIRSIMFWKFRGNRRIIDRKFDGILEQNQNVPRNQTEFWQENRGH